VGKVAADPVIRCGMGPDIMSVIENTRSYRDVDYHCYACCSVRVSVVGYYDWCRLLINSARPFALVSGVSCR
jgi:hypothetical protein